MQKKVVSFDNVKINYDINKHSRDFLVFLHGAGGDLNAWKKERKFFHKKGISTLAIDLRGHGLSDRPNLLKDYKLDNFAKDIYHVLKKEKIKDFILIGHCFGGVIAINFHKLHPTLASGYILIDTTYKAPRILSRMFKRRSTFVKILNKIVKIRNPVLTKRHVNYDKFVGTLDLDPKRIYSDIIQTSFKSWLFAYENLAKFNGIDTLKSMKQPVLIIEGEEDTIFDVLVAKKIKKLIKKSTLKIVPKANHIIVINNPEILQKEIWSFVLPLRVHNRNL